MGGSGSGRWGFHWKKTTVDECLKFSLTDLTRPRRQPLPELVGRFGMLGWTGGSSMGYRVQRGNNSLLLILEYSVGGQARVQTVRISETECNYGGVRYWMHCPHCSRRVGKLYGAGGQFACRQCHELTYTSAQEGHRFDDLRRSMGIYYGMRELLKKWDARKRLTKGERRKIARLMGWPLFMIRSRWYRRDVQKRRTHESVRRVFKSLLKKSESHDRAT